MHELVITPLSLVFSFSLVLIAVAVSYKEKLGLNKDLIISVIRMVVQLVIAGYLLTYVFQWDSKLVTVVVILIMVTNASYNASKRANGIPHAFKISMIAILVGTIVAIVVLVLSGTLLFTPSQLIPVTGMLVGNGMSIIGLTFRNLTMLFHDKHQSVDEKLALGATTKQASKEIIQETIKGSLQPTIDTVRTVGLVTLPGMMTGMMLAGTLPMEAIMYQIMVFFMMISTATITSVISAYLSFPYFFDNAGRYIGVKNK